MFKFEIIKKLDSNLGRAGVITTPHGEIQTPAFVTVGTKASVKAVTPEQVADAGVQVVLANTYHLYLQPGDELVRDAGGLGKFMGWQKNGQTAPTMTDSGGFQVFSLGVAYGKDISKVVSITDPNFLIPERSIGSEEPLAKVSNDGVSFKSHLDGSLHYITPEKSIEIQHNLGADIIFAFDECTSPTEDFKYQSEALDRTHAWAKRSLEFHKSKNTNQALFGVVQGGRNEELRKKSAQIIGDMEFDGFGIGGSFAKEDMETAVKWVNEVLPEEKPRHLLGIGEPEDLFMGVENGVDLFDCVGPTRIARNGTVFTKNGKINLLNAKFVNLFEPIEKDCGCYVCSGVLREGGKRSFLEEEQSDGKGEILRSPGYTCAYLSHLFRAKEMQGATLATIHNLYFITHLVADMRTAIINGTFKEFKTNFLKNYLK